MQRALGKSAQTGFAALILSALFALGGFAQSPLSQDPPSRVARLNYMGGNVSMEPAGLDDWAPAVVNHPFTTGDYLYTDQGARAELHLDIAAMRMGPQTSFGFLNLNDQAVQIKLTEGDMYFRVHNFGPNETFEVDTPNAAVTLLRDGEYRFRVDPNGTMTFVVVRQGQAEITGGGQAFTLNPGNSAMLTGTDQLAYDVEVAPAPDDFDNWCVQRDAHEARLASAKYLPPTVIGYEDLDDYGVWQETGDYGPVWYPRQVSAGWAPYHEGHWAWVEPWGWTWVDAAPWGFAPFHYGRWAYIHDRWGWCPGPIVVGYRGPVVRPYYAPALVAWFGGAHWGVSISAGGPSLGWVPLGFGEVFTPSYACSRAYFTNVNVYNTRVVRTVNITNVYNTVYVNHTVYNREFVNVRAPNAVIAMPQSAFASGRAVHQAGFAVREADFRRMGAGAVVVSPPVAPARQALASTVGRPAPHPAAQIFQRQVVARNTPAPAPASFAVRQQYLQQHAGQPHDFAAMHQVVAARPVAAAAIRQAPAARPIQVRPGQRFGNQADFRGRTSPAEPSSPATAPRYTAQPAQNSRFAGRNQTPAPPAQQNQAPSQPQITERTRPQAERPDHTDTRYAARPQNPQAPHPAPPPPAFERTQPRPEQRQESRPAAAPQPRYEERNQPRVEEHQPRPETRSESRPAAPPPAAHGPPTPPHEEHRNGPPAQHEEHKDKDKDHK